MKISQTLLDLLIRLLHLPEELILTLDDTLVKKWGKKFFGLGYYPDPTDKNPGASKRRVLGHCWVVLALPDQYAKAQLTSLTRDQVRCILVSRLRSNAALYLLPPKPRRSRPPASWPPR